MTGLRTDRLADRSRWYRIVVETYAAAVEAGLPDDVLAAIWNLVTREAALAEGRTP